MTISLLVCIVGLLLWLLPTGRGQAVGQVMFSWGLLVWLLVVGGAVVLPLQVGR